MREKPNTIKLELHVGKSTVDRLADQAEFEGISLRDHIIHIVQEAAESGKSGEGNSIPPLTAHDAESQN